MSASLPHSPVLCRAYLCIRNAVMYVSLTLCWNNDAQTPHFAGALAIAVQGLRAESSDCLNCARVETERACVAVATGVPPRANSSLSGFTIGLNVGDFAAD